MTLRSAAPLSQAREVASDSDSLLRYFDLLEGMINENGLGDKPAQLFNMDESSMPLDPKPLLLICQHGMKHPSSIGSRDKAQITVVGSVSAVGMCIPPMDIWDRKTISPELAKGEVPGTITGSQAKDGWTVNYSTFGFPTISFAMPPVQGHCYCSLMGTPPIFAQIQFD